MDEGFGCVFVEELLNVQTRCLRNFLWKNENGFVGKKRAFRSHGWEDFGRLG